MVNCKLGYLCCCSIVALLYLNLWFLEHHRKRRHTGTYSTGTVESRVHPRYAHRFAGAAIHSLSSGARTGTSRLARCTSAILLSGHSRTINKLPSSAKDCTGLANCTLFGKRSVQLLRDQSEAPEHGFRISLHWSYCALLAPLWPLKTLDHWYRPPKAPFFDGTRSAKLSIAVLLRSTSLARPWGADFNIVVTGSTFGRSVLPFRLSVLIRGGIHSLLYRTVHS